MPVKATYVKECKEAIFTASGNLSAGDIIVRGDIGIGVVARDVASGSQGLAYLSGLYDIPCSSLTVKAGDRVYWDASNGAVTTTAAGNVFLGTAINAVTSSDVVIRVDVGRYIPDVVSAGT